MVEKALDYVAGYCLYNDFSQRTVQQHELEDRFGFTKSKAINAMGPFLVSGIDPERVAVHVKVNGREVLSCGLAGMTHSLAQVIAYISSQGEGIAAGEVIGLGTMSGGSLFELDLPMLQPGDQVEIIGNQGLGILCNRIAKKM